MQCISLMHELKTCISCFILRWVYNISINVEILTVVITKMPSPGAYNNKSMRAHVIHFGASHWLHSWTHFIMSNKQPFPSAPWVFMPSQQSSQRHYVFRLFLRPYTCTYVPFSWSGYLKNRLMDSRQTWVMYVLLQSQWTDCILGSRGQFQRSWGSLCIQN